MIIFTKLLFSLSDIDPLIQQLKQNKYKSFSMVKTQKKRLQTISGRQPKGKKYTKQKKSNNKSYLKSLQTKYRKRKFQQIIAKIHKDIAKGKKIDIATYQIQQQLKICKQCRKWNNISTMYTCNTCEDTYHKQCSDHKPYQGIYACNSCLAIIQKKIKNKCFKCQKNFQDFNHKKCQKCLQKYDSKCFNERNPNQSICYVCQQIENATKNAQKQTLSKEKGILEKKNIKKSNALFQFNDLVSPKEVKFFRKSLIDAIEDKKMQYSQSLIYLCDKIDLDLQKTMDFGARIMNKSEVQQYDKYKRQPLGPFIVKYTKDKGYDVIAAKRIPKKSLICQYIGEVISLRQCIFKEQFSNNDSLMQLVNGIDADTTLIIRPQKITNIARFINGAGKKKDNINVESIKFYYENNPVILLIAKKDINQGESLIYDYNAGGIEAMYNTSQFV